MILIIRRMREYLAICKILQSQRVVAKLPFQIILLNVQAQLELRHNKKITSELNSLGESILLNSHGKTHLLKKLFKVEIVCHHLGAKPRFVSYVLETIGENIHTFNEW
jgi:hypothetical protein